MSMFLHRAGLMKRLALSSVSLIVSNGATATSFTMPTVKGGDLFVIFNASRTNAGPAPAAVIPNDFTTLLNIEDGFTRMLWTAKICDGSESGTIINTMDGASADRRVYFQFRGNLPILSFSVESLASEMTDGDPSPQVVASSGGTSPIIVLAGYNTDTLTLDPRNFTPAADGEVQAGANNAWAKYKIYNSSPADVTVDMDDEQRNILSSFYLQLI